jgi:CheY-like chemotaxis protein
MGKLPLVLIVDDVPENLQVLGNNLKNIACRIAFATGGIQALRMIEQVQPDMILLDIMMPDMDGLELCRKLKSSLDTSEVPVIFLTAKNEGEDIVEGFRAGAVDYVTKPFNSDELLARVRTHLELKKIRDEQKDLIEELQQALAEVKRLSGLIPICTYCKKIRDDEGYWGRVEKFIAQRSDAQFSHAICPDCLDEHFPPEEDEEP